MATDEFIGTADVATLFGVDRSVIVRRVQAGDLTPALKLAGLRGAYLFERSAVEALAEVERNLS